MKGDLDMDSKQNSSGKVNPDEKITIQTGNGKYSFSKDWVENKALNNLLVGLIADDLTQQLNPDNFT